MKRLLVLMALGCSLSGVASAEKGTSPTRPAADVPFTTISGNPLKINVGSDASFQIFNKNVNPSGNLGQIFPAGQTTLADMGAFLRTGGTLYAPRFSERTSATGQLGSYQPWSAVSLSAVTGTGALADPFTVTVVVDAGGTGIRMTMTVRYVDGQNYFTETFDFTSTQTRQFDFYFGADIYLASDDEGIPFRDAFSGSVGGQDCGLPPTYTILFVPFTPADLYAARFYSQIWHEIGLGPLSDTINENGCEDNGAALEWQGRTVTTGSTTRIRSGTSFGAIPSITQFRIDGVGPAYGLPGQTRTVNITGLGFQAGTTFGFGAGITVDTTQINSSNDATLQITMAPDAALGFRNVTAVQTAQPDSFSDTLANGFQVVDSIQDATITKTHAGSFTGGGTGAFTLTVRNLGENATTKPVKVTDILPPGLGFVSGTGAGWTCSATGPVVTCDNASQIAGNGGESSFILTVSVDGRAIPAVTNAAKVELEGDLDPTNNSTTDVVAVIGLDLALQKSHLGNFAVGGNGAFNLRVKNVGTVATVPPVPISIGSVANSRFGTDWTLDGPNMKRTADKLLNTANFGAGGIIPRSITIDNVAGVDSVTSARLANYDLFFVGYLFDSSLAAFTSNELDAMKSYVMGGGTMVVSCDDPGYDKVCDFFGYPVLSTAPNPLKPTVYGASHPIFNGPFGQVTSFEGSQTIGYFFDETGADVLARDSNNLPVMLEKRFGTGRLILIADVDFVALACTTGGTVTSANDRLLGNLFAYAAKFAPIVVTDTLPPGLTYVSASGTGWSCSGSGSSFTCTSPGPLAPGQFSDISLTVAVDAAAAPVATNRGRVAIANDSNPANDTAQDTVTIGGSVPTPSVNEITPNFGPIVGGTAVTITGSNFDSGAAVVFDGTYYASSVVVVDAATITCLTPPHVAGAVDVVVVNPSGQNRSLQGGFTYLTTTPTSGFYTVTPCRAVDTRGADGPYGGPALSAGSPRSFVLGGQCGVPADAKALALNLTAVGPTKGGNVRLYPTGNSPGASSTLNFGAGQTRANNALAGVDAAGSLTVLADGPPDMTVHLIVDVSGYFK